MERAPEGLRARKKRAAREHIASTARRLFAEHGYDSVTVAQVAAAAEVAEKTVFNYFPTKEDLAFAGREEGIAQFVAAIAGREPGTPIVEVFRAMTLGVFDLIAAGNEDFLAAAQVIRGSATLQERLTVGWEAGAVAITAAVAEAVGATDDDLVPDIVARTLWFTHRSVFLRVLEGVVAGEDPKRLVKRLKRDADRAYDQLAEGFGNY